MDLSLAEARRLAVAAGGLTGPRPAGRIDRRHARAVLDRLGVIQLDSVAAVARAHELVLLARLGAHPRDLPWRLVAAGEAFEWWGHEASLLPVDLHPPMRRLMAEAALGRARGGLERLERERPGFVARIAAEVRDHGPVSARELAGAEPRRGPWWGWHDAKHACELLFLTGEVTAVRRGFERRYVVPERVIPKAVLDLPVPDADEARRTLLLRAARAIGVGTEADLADHFRLRAGPVRPLVRALVGEGALERVRVEGWPEPAYVLPGARPPARATRAALLAPFDPLVWFRPRLERLFGMRYRIEIYTPAPRRRYGYYVLPLLAGSALIGRADVRARRDAGTLEVLGAWAEPRADVRRGAPPVAAELTRMAAWLGLERVVVADRGDLAPALARALS
ncbi:MAG: winged helix DNA-binding domain-containing protein [Thermoleophilia bacterium]|nr:winged helix DNA-binding domain-containing protein [Thermoleophilia bacterium]